MHTVVGKKRSKPGVGANRFPVARWVQRSDSPGEMPDLARISRIGNKKSRFDNRILKIQEKYALKALSFACRE